MNWIKSPAIRALDQFKLLHYKIKTSNKMNRVFGRRTDPYGYASHPHETRKYEVLFSHFSHQRFKKALELGCAEGVFTLKLAEICEEVLGVDISEKAIARAKARCQSHPQVQFLKTELLAADFQDPFDLIVASEVLYYLDRSAVQKQFHEFVNKTVSHLTQGGQLALLHSFANEKELAIRTGYRKLFENAGLLLTKEIQEGIDPQKPRYLISILSRP